MKNLFQNIATFFLIFLIISGILGMFNLSPERRPEKISFSSLVSEIKKENVKKIVIKEERLEIVLRDGSKKISRKEREISFSDALKNYGIAPEKIEKINIQIAETSFGQIFFSQIFPILLPILLLVFLFIFFSRAAKQVNLKTFGFGQSGAREITKESLKKNRVTFEDVAGLKEAKEELKEIIDFLKHPKKFTELGARIPKGILLTGPAGVGKTLLAKAVAGEAEVPFFQISASEFMEMFVGIGASRVRDLFKRAKKTAPSLIFIDELDAIGKKRGLGYIGGHGEQEQTLNQILTEMDGFETDTRVVVLAATNRPDILDSALLRPGRFDRKVVLDEPDLKGRIEILKVHTRSKPLASEVDFKEIAGRIPGFSGADISNLVNEAAILAAKKGKKKIYQTEFLESIEKVLIGPERKSRILSKKEKEIAAFHEAGHALIAFFLNKKVQKISVVSRGRAAGYTLQFPSEETHFHSKSEFMDELAILLAGRIAEKEIFSEITTGAANDLQQATELARKLVIEYGMSDLGPISFGPEELIGREFIKPYSEEIAAEIDQEVRKIISLTSNKALDLIKEKKEKLERLAKELEEKETIETEEFEKLMKES